MTEVSFGPISWASIGLGVVLGLLFLAGWHIVGAVSRRIEESRTAHDRACAEAIRMIANAKPGEIIPCPPEAFSAARRELAKQAAEAPVLMRLDAMRRRAEEAKATLGEMRWRSFESAPKDGAFVFLSDGLFARIGFWSENRWADMARAEGTGPRDLPFVPRYWMPLPRPPERDR